MFRLKFMLITQPLLMSSNANAVLNLPCEKHQHLKPHTSRPHCTRSTLWMYLDVGVQIMIQIFFVAFANNVDQHSADNSEKLNPLQTWLLNNITFRFLKTCCLSLIWQKKKTVKEFVLTPNTKRSKWSNSVAVCERGL